MNYNVDLECAEVIDDWEYNNYKQITYSFNYRDVIENVLDNKIFIARLKLDSKFDIGYSIFAINDEIFEIDIWISTKELKYLDVDEINENNNLFYGNLTKIIINIFKDNSLLLAGIGVETVIKYNSDLVSIIKNSKNVVRWILPYNCIIQNEEIDFHIHKINKFYICSIYKLDLLNNLEKEGV